MAASTTKSSAGGTTASTTEKKRNRDAKSRYNIGVVYLKTGDFAKAAENLSHSLYCYIQLHGDDTSKYSREASIQIASVREKLGDCYASNPEWGDKRHLAMDHYVEVRRLLQGIEKVEGEAEEMLGRVEEKINDPELLMADSGVGRVRSVPMPEVPAAYLRAQTPKKRREGGITEGKDRGARQAKDPVGRRVAKGKNGGSAPEAPAQLVRNGTKNIQNIGRGFIDSLGGMIEDVDDLMQKRSKGMQIFKPKSGSGPDYVRSDTAELSDSCSSCDNPAYVDSAHKDAAAAKKIKEFTRAARRNMQKISTGRSLSRGRSAHTEVEDQGVQSDIDSIESDYDEEASPEHSSAATFKYRSKTSRRANQGTMHSENEKQHNKHSSRSSSTSTINSEREERRPKKQSSRRSSIDSEYSEHQETNQVGRSRSGMGSQLKARDGLKKAIATSLHEEGKRPSRRSSIDSEYSKHQETNQVGRSRSGMGSQLKARDGLKKAIATSQYEEGGSVCSHRDRSTKEIIRDYQETVGKMRAQLNEERRGFAIMSCKFVEEKSKMSAEIQDLSWKVALRGKRINRLEKEKDKLSKRPAEAVVKVDHLHWANMDLGEFFLHVESKFFKLEKELEGCKWVIESLMKMDPRSPSLPFRLDLLLQGLEEMASIAEMLIDGLENWLSTHAEAATKNEELFFHVENRFRKLQNELKLCEGIVESLAKSTPGPTNLPARLHMLLDGLNEVAAIKNELFKSSTTDTKKSQSSVTTASQAKGQITKEPSLNESAKADDISINEIVLKKTSSYRQFSKPSSSDKCRNISPGSETTETTATMSTSVDTFATMSPNDAKDFQAMAARVSSQRSKPKRSQQRHNGRPRGASSHRQ